MLLTLYYMYATFLQWWRISTMRNQISRAITNQTTLVLYHREKQIPRQQCANIKDLLFITDTKLACTMMPKRKVFLNMWMPFSSSTLFPFVSNNLKLNSPCFPILIHADFKSFVSGNDYDKIYISNLGVPIAWTAEEDFSIVLKTDLDNFAKLANSFLRNSIVINDGMEVLRIETIDLDGEPKIMGNEYIFKKIKWPFPVCSHRQWNKFVEDLKHVCKKTANVAVSKNGNVCNKMIEEKINKTTIPIIVNDVDPNINISSKKPDNHLEHSSKHKAKTESKIDKKHKKISDKSNCSVEKFKDRRSTSREKEKMKHSSSMDKIKHREHHSKEYPERHKGKEISHKVKREKFVKKHSKENVLDVKVADETQTKEKIEKKEITAKEKIEKKEVTTKEKIENKIENVDELVAKKSFVKAKPPNVLVYADSLETRENVKRVLQEVLNINRYTIYELSSSGQQHFTDNCILVVVSGNIAPILSTDLLHYLLNGGNLLCLCSDFLNSVLPTFTTAEVREHELVRFSYGEWQRVRMMHHIFCYQASPVKKHFSQDSDPNSSNHSSGNSPVAPRTPSTVELHHNNKTYTVQVRVLGQEETWQTPSILFAAVKSGIGKAVFSQVHLEIDPTQYEGDEDKYAALKESNSSRLEILKDILSTYLDMDCSSVEKSPDEYTPAFFLGTHDLKLQLLSEIPQLLDNILKLPKVTLQFCGKGVEPPIATSAYIPILIHACPEDFSTIEYFENLKTQHLGRLVIYSDKMGSSMDVLANVKYKHGIVILPKQQSAGLGRGGNVWLSPIGCAMFSMQVHIPMDSILANSLPLLQHLSSLAIVSAIKTLPGYEEIDIGLKWPNDIYANLSVKIGGIILNTTVESTLAISNIGCGVNLSNSLPTTCINSLITKYNETKGTSLKTFSYEKFLALVFTEMERILDIVQAGNLNYLYDLYYKYWLHTDSEITVQTSDGSARDVTITGIDQYGFLIVRSKDGVTSSVEPDGNTFDMLQGLIAPKIR